MTSSTSEVRLTLPKWAENRPIYIMAGSELLAFYCKGELWIKTKRCNLCGECCIVTKDWRLGWKTGDKVGWSKKILVCRFLERELWNFDRYKNQVVYVCKAGARVPYGCCVGPTCEFPDFKRDYPHCSLEFKKVVK